MKNRIENKFMRTNEFIMLSLIFMTLISCYDSSEQESYDDVVYRMIQEDDVSSLKKYVASTGYDLTKFTKRVGSFNYFNPIGHVAAENNSAKTVYYLDSLNYDFSLKGFDGLTILMEYVQSHGGLENVEFFSYLLSKVDIHTQDVDGSNVVDYILVFDRVHYLNVLIDSDLLSEHEIRKLKEKLLDSEYLPYTKKIRNYLLKVE